MQFNLIFHQGEAPLFLLFCPPSAFGKFLLNVESRYSSLINKQGLTPSPQSITSYTAFSFLPRQPSKMHGFSYGASNAKT